MSTWKDFEIQCTEYLNSCYGTYAKFTLQGGANSTVPDIYVKTNTGSSFYIEVKEPNAQSGQFVLLPDEINKKFVFSPRNKTAANEFTDIITVVCPRSLVQFQNQSEPVLRGISFFI